MPNDFIQEFGVDVVGQDGVNKLDAVFKQFNTTIAKTEKVSARFNSEMETVAATYNVTTKAGEKYAVTLANVGEGLEVVGATLKATNLELKAHAKAVDEAWRAELRYNATLRDFQAAVAGGLSGGKSKRSTPGFIVDETAVRNALEYESVLDRIVTQTRSVANRDLSGLNGPSPNGNLIHSAFTADTDKSTQSQVQYTKATWDAYNASIAQMHQLNRTTEAFKRHSDGVLLSWQSMKRLLIIQLLHQSFSAFIRALRDGAAEAIQFSKRIAEIRTLSISVNQTTREWSDAVLQLSDSFGFTALDSAAATYEALSNQISNTANEMHFLREAAILATVTNSTLAQSSDAAASVMNSFGLSVSASERIMAVLFKTVDLGKSTMEELGENLGRVNVLSDQLNVSFEEQSALLATLSISGLKDSTAKTLLINVYNKLIRPSEKMQEIFEKWGVTSGQNAIDTFGLAQVFNMLGVEAEITGDKTSEIGEIFQRLRATTGFLGIDLERAAQSLEEMKNSAADFDAAELIAFESTGKKIETQWQRVSNSFLRFGNSAQETIVYFTDNYISLKDALAGSLQLVKIAAVAYAAYTVKVRLAAAAQTVLWSRMTATRALFLLMPASIQKATTSLALFRRGVQTLGVTIQSFQTVATFGLSIVAGVLAEMTFSSIYWRDQLLSDTEDVREAISKLGEETLKDSLKAFDIYTLAVEERVKTMATSVGELLRQLRLENDAFSSSVKDTISEFTGSFGDEFEGAFDTVGENFDAIKDKTRELEQSLKATTRTLENLNKEFESGERDLKFDVIDANTKGVDALNKSFEDLNEAFEADDVEAFKESVHELLSNENLSGITNFGKLQGILEGITDTADPQRLNQLAKELAAFYATARPANPIKLFEDRKAQKLFNPATDESLQSYIQDLQKIAGLEGTTAGTRLQIEREIQSVVQARIKLAEDSKVKEEKALEKQKEIEAQRAARVKETLDAYKKLVGLKDSATLEDFNKAAAPIEKNIELFDPVAQLKLVEKLQEQRDKLGAATESDKTREELAKNQAIAERLRATAETITKEYAQLRSSFTENLSGNLIAEADALELLSKQIDNSQASFANKATNAFIDTKIAEIQALIVRAQKSTDPREIQALLAEKKNKESSLVAELDTTLFKNGKNVGSFLFGDGIKEFSDKYFEAGEKTNELTAENIEKLTELAAQDKQANVSLAEIANVLKELKDALPFKRDADPTEELEDQLREFNIAVPESVQKFLDGVRASIERVEGQREGFAFGNGSDVIRANLSPGERVIDRQTESRFGPLLAALQGNRNTPSTTTVSLGGITVAGGQSDAGTARNILQELRREIRRTGFSFA